MPLIALMLLALAQAQVANPDIGGQLAQRWCTRCHMIAGIGHGQEIAPPLPPPPEQGQRWLRAWLRRPHPPMPDMHLSEQEIEDLVAYLQTLPQT